MTSYGYFIMIIVDSCMIRFHFDCIMQLKKSYHITTNVCSRKKCYYFWWSPWLLNVGHLPGEVFYQGPMGWLHGKTKIDTLIPKKWSTSSRLNTQMHFLECKYLNFYQNINEIRYWWSSAETVRYWHATEGPRMHIYASPLSNENQTCL